ncbi:MAG: 6-carboxytetrahydropterin synthase QueD [Candidatus Neomarinimicrobiota bacterium]|jgi:6-pyruvoyltetrahydropterin/6-carboxytetrahydropterin synthase|nr:6-carboxytetrahydropterin synthase QueD [Candidatus Neomarinimicrobiota bacterium]|tara:strand:+ start:417 stop:788 length:372 start_codon:yes stop_codon:yes gene_type:complete
MIVYKKFNVESARSLPNVPETHPCYQLHGHSFKIIISVKGQLDKHTGFVTDFQEIENAFNPIKKILDHSFLNKIEGLSNPTSENICIWIWDKIESSIPNICEIEIKETDSTGCIYRGRKNGKS